MAIMLPTRDSLRPHICARNSDRQETHPVVRSAGIALLITLLSGPPPAAAQTPVSARPTPPTRDPHTPGYVRAKELRDGVSVPVNKDGNFILGPTHVPAPQMTPRPGVPIAKATTFTTAHAPH